MLPGWEDKGAEDWGADTLEQNNEPDFYDLPEEIESAPEPAQKKPRGRTRRVKPSPRTSRPTASFQMFADPINNQVAAAGVEMFKDKLDEQFGHYFKASVFSLDYYKYYFCVDNSYVLNKLKLIFLPFLSHTWRREEHFVNGSSNEVQFLVPKQDINAPDAYLPLMAFITYIIMMYIVVGQGQKESISPQIITKCASSALGVMVFQTILFRIAFYFLNVSILAPGWLDNLCYSGYKLLYVILNLLVYLASGNDMVYYAVSFLTGLLSAYFLVKTLLPFFQFESSIEKPFIVMMLLVELLLIQVLGRTGVH